MSTLVRAIIFSSELVVYVIVSVVATYIFWKKDCKNDITYVLSKYQNPRKNRKINIVCFSILFLFILGIFLFAYPSFVFLSYNKMVLVSSTIILSSLLIILEALEIPKNDELRFSFGTLSVIIYIAILFSFILGNINNYEDKVILEQRQTEIQEISPSISSENQIAYTSDYDGNIETYSFYYKDNEGSLNFKKLNALEKEIIESENGDIETEQVEVIYIKNKDSYIVKESRITEYVKREKKSTEKDYTFTETNTIYKIYLNKEQLVYLNN